MAVYRRECLDYDVCRNNETQVHSLYLHEECAIILILEAKENLLDIWMHGQLLVDFVEDLRGKKQSSD